MSDTGKMTGGQVWSRVVAFARHARRTGKQVPTLTRGILNTIAEVDEDRGIERRSAAGRTHKKRVTRDQVEKVWSVVRRGSSWKNAETWVLYFTPALMLAAMDDCLVNDGAGGIRLKR